MGISLNTAYQMSVLSNSCLPILVDVGNGEISKFENLLKKFIIASPAEFDKWYVVVISTNSRYASLGHSNSCGHCKSLYASSNEAPS